MHLFFSTPIWTSKIDNYEKVNLEMIDYITDLQTNNPEGIIKSNFKGWHSRDFDMQKEQPKKFIEAIRKNTNTALTDMN